MKFNRKIAPDTKSKLSFITKKRLREDEINFKKLRSYRLDRVKKALKTLEKDAVNVVEIAIVGGVAANEELRNSDDLNENSKLNIEIPKNLNEANDISKKRNPKLIIAKLEYLQSEKDIRIAQSDMLPSASLSFEASQTEDLSSTYNERDKKILKATIKWPFYTGGKNKAEVNKNRNIKYQKKLLLDNVINTNNTDVGSAWSNFQSSKSLLDSIRSQVKAAEIANEGITVEYESGLGRSTLDVIQSSSLLLDSKISLANSERNYLLSQFKLLQSIGLLTLEYLQIN